MDFRQLTKDFNQRYSNSYIFLTTPEGGENLVYLNEVFLRDEADFPYLSITSPALGTNVIRFDTEYAIKFKRPPLGVFQHGPVAYTLFRSFQQTYSKGINDHTYTIIPVFSRTYSIQCPPFDVLIKAAFAQQRFTLESALKKLSIKKALAVALSKRISLALSASDNTSYDVYFYNYYIGKTDLNGKLQSPLNSFKFSEFEQ